MISNIPKIGENLTQEHTELLSAFTKSCRATILKMLKQSQSGHPGGSLSSLDYLATLYAFILGQTGEKIVVSHGHISPAVYSVLAEMGYIPKQEMIDTFRQFGSKYEGHVTRHVDGIFFGTGPLGVGVSVAGSFALAEKMKETDKKVYALMGDGEVQEGQVYEMINHAKHNKLDNLILFVDYNKVQLTSTLEEIQDIDIKKIFEAGGWHVIEANGHDYSEIWKALAEAQNTTGKPIVIIGDTIMGKGVEFMEVDGQAMKSTWHGKPPKPEMVDEELPKLELSEDEKQNIEEFRKLITWKPESPRFTESLTRNEINIGEQTVYDHDNTTDCRNAYGKALADLAGKNKNVLALSADLKSSNMTKYVSEQQPAQHIECGIAEQNMVSLAGGLSLCDYIPFCSTFGAFLSSRAKDQARVNDINQCNVKMVATHCGLSVGEDGPTHQAIDDMGSFLGMYNTMIVEPADPNHCDRLTRYLASHYGNFYMRMGRHKITAITKEDGSIFYDADYKYEYGKCDKLREGSDVTIIAIGSMVEHAILAQEHLKEKGIHAEVIAASAIKKFDQTLIDSVEKTKKVVTVEDHNSCSGLGSQVAKLLLSENIAVDSFKILGTEKYELSGTPEKLWHNAGIDTDAIVEACK